MSKYGIQNSLLSDTIVIGPLNKSQDMFLDKEDHTTAAIHAVIDHIHKRYGDKLKATVGNYQFEITVKTKETY